MPAPFDALEDRLLRGGIAPRHVKRYLRELSEHLADLTAAQAEAGFDAGNAAARARAALGPDQELADAMLKQRDFRSISARFPWLVFGIMPPFAVVLGSLLWVIAMVLVGVKGGAFIPDHHNIPHLIPVWYQWIASGMMFAVNFLFVPSLALLLAWMAQRQRMKPLWPLLGMALILALSIHGTFQIDAKGRILLGLGTIVPWKGPLGPGGIDWPILLVQAALLCLPLVWLLRRQHKTDASA